MGDRNPGNLKREFAQWMRSHLGYQASEENVPVGAVGGVRERGVGVRGEKYGVVWQHLRSVAFVAFAVAVVLRNVAPAPEGDVPVLPNALFCLAAVAYVAAYLGRLRTHRFAWVECKDLKRAVSREDMLALLDTVQRVRASATAKWKPAEVVAVAGAKGFDDDALAFAQSQGVECYRRTESGFERAS